MQSIYGMNIREITGEEGAHRIWEYAAVSLGLMALTFIVWYVWAKLSVAIQSTRVRRSETGELRKARESREATRILQSSGAYQSDGIQEHTRQRHRRLGRRLGLLFRQSPLKKDEHNDIEM